MSEQSSHFNATAAGNGTVIGASIVAAGIAGLGGATLMGRQNRKERTQERVEKRVSDLEARATEAMAQLNRAVEGLSFDRSGQTRAARKQVKRLSKTATAATEEALKGARKRAAEIDKEVRNLRVAEGANRLANEGSDRAAALSATLNERIATAVDEVRQGISGWGDRASAQASAVAETSSEKARASVQPVKDEATRLTQDVKALSADLITQGAALVAEARHKSPELLERAKGATHEAAVHARDVSPELRDKIADTASKAAERGSELVARAKERAPEVQEAVTSSVSATVHDLQEQARPLIAEAGAAAAKAAEQARTAARDAGQTILPEVQHQADALGGRMSTTTHAIEHKSRRAASAAGQGSRDFGALALWSAVAGGVAYLALLNEEQQRRVRESGKRVWAEIREVFADIRGYDEEFA
jgi:dsDNA-specific endonuclease/ATPase MutS2